MNKLISLNTKKINNELVNTVNARDLWKQLQSKRQFADWIKDRLTRFVENVDYILISQNCEIKKRGGDRKSIDYFLTVDTAKMICMLENNEIGDKIRRYFIQCEKELFNRKNLRIESIRNRMGLTDKIKELYGDIIERNKQDGIKDWTYTNYTKLVYKKVFGKSKANEIKKMYRLSEKENIRDSLKIPQDKITEIVDWEYSIHCYLQTLKKQNTPISELYDKVKNFLQLN
ncbi:MAG: antA/AntB antirepressor family protein [Romboutsia timonensis]|uniref:antA/AntB antirepressor family protein n=1 Tax=Romboutsia timonensis TaxID=1776391 RepID=UPI002A75005D|nr:antA/AntB antirepressor family protein [Romboutsia timonensis]MDY2882579.1 antA/AntB antirepressor family protein [Romboutsia timonensis]